MKFVNEMSLENFKDMFGNIVEHTEQVAENLWNARPFQSEEDFMKKLLNVIDQLPQSCKISVLEGHPDLAGRLADANLLTPESTREQKAAGLDLLSEDEKRRLKSHNDKYRCGPENNCSVPSLKSGGTQSDVQLF